MIDRSHIYLSTVADIGFEEGDGDNPPRIFDNPVSAELAHEYGLGLEIAEFCTASNIDGHFDEYDRIIRAKIQGVDRLVLHAPFNELFPSAIDPMVLKVTRFRYNQAVGLARSYGINRLVIHSGFIPQLFFKSWFADRSIEFWQDFLRDKPGDLQICLENVLEDEPELLCCIAERVGDARLRLCLDTGHAFSASKVDPLEWVRVCAPYLAHLHIHNNTGEYDMHNALGDGGINMAALLETCGRLCPEATYTIETVKLKESLDWLGLRHPADLLV